MDNEKVELIKNKYGLPVHYYGDAVRNLFILGSLIMIISLPFLTNRIPVPIFVAILAIILLNLGAGFMAPRKKRVIFLDLVISIASLIVFEFYAVQAYKLYSYMDSYFIVNQILAINFLFASYYSAKTTRSLQLK